MTKGERIRKLRERTGKTLTAFADAIGVSKQTLYKYENDIITNVPSDKIEMIAELSGCSPCYVMGWEEVEQKDIVFMTPTSEERDFLVAYRQASADRKDAVRLLLGLQK